MEFAISVPVLVVCLLYMADCSFVLYALICVQEAARSVAARNASGVESAVDTDAACLMALGALEGLPGVGAAGGTCNGAPVKVTSVYCSGRTTCGPKEQTADGEPAVYVTVAYSFPAAFDLPLMRELTVTRASEMKVRNVQ